MNFLTMKNQRELLLDDGVRVPHALLSPIAGVMRSLSARWKLEILFAMQEGSCRFGQLMRATPGITQHMLTVRLRELEADGFVTRHDYAEVPPRVEYALTPAAQELRPVFVALVDWVRSHAPVMLDSARQSKAHAASAD